MKKKEKENHFCSTCPLAGASSHPRIPMTHPKTNTSLTVQCPLHHFVPSHSMKHWAFQLSALLSVLSQWKEWSLIDLKYLRVARTVMIYESLFTVFISTLTGIAVDKNGLMYFVDATMIRKVDQNGIISTLLGANDLTAVRPLSCDTSMDVSQVRHFGGSEEETRRWRDRWWSNRPMSAELWWLGWRRQPARGSGRDWFRDRLKSPQINGWIKRECRLQSLKKMKKRLVWALASFQNASKITDIVSCKIFVSAYQVRLEWPTDLAVNPMDNSLYVLENNVILRITENHQVCTTRLDRLCKALAVDTH